MVWYEYNVTKYRNTSSDELAEAASKIGLLSPEQFEPNLPPPDLGKNI